MLNLCDDDRRTVVRIRATTDHESVSSRIGIQRLHFDSDLVPIIVDRLLIVADGRVRRR